MIRDIWPIFLLKSGAIFFRFRNFLFPVFIITLFVFTKPALFLGRRKIDFVVVILGFIIALLGMLFRLFVIGFDYIKRGGKDGRVYADGLVTGGIYSHVRNPMYIGNFFCILGIALIYGSLWAYIFVLPFFVYIYLSIVVTEENYLRSHFGAEYETYCKRVNRFIPNFSGLRNTLEKFSYDWRKAIRKDYGTFFGVLLGCYLTWLRKIYYFRALKHSKYELLIILFPLILIGLSYCLVRYLKKRELLSS
jgi:protein-S-isoprenylcysteine O-methyltransferase Ste14